MKILVTGSVAYDILLTYDGSFADGIDPKNLQALSVSYVTPHLARHHGGTGANVAWNVRLLNGDPLLVSTVGTDGGPYLALLEERGVSTQYIEKRSDAVTATAIVGTDHASRQITFYHPGADARGQWPDPSTPLGMTLIEERDDLAYAIVSPRDAQNMVHAVEWCHSYGVPVLFDPGQQVTAFPADDLKRLIGRSTGIISNAYEWSLLMQSVAMTEGELLELTSMLIVTHGEDGLTIVTREGSESIPACRPDRLVNPTGAGDGLRAGLMMGLSRGWSLLDAGRLGASVASFVVEIEGTLLDSLDLDEVWNRAEGTYGQPLPSLKQ